MTERKKERVEIKEGILYVGDSAEVGVNEKELQEFLIEQLVRSSDKVLEIGYGLGHASRAITSKSPQSHTIIEVNEELCEVAKQEFTSAHIINDMWQNVSEDVFREATKVIYEPTPENPLLTDKELALEHIRPISAVLKRVSVGTHIGVIDPSGKLHTEEIRSLIKSNIKIKITACPADIVPKDTPWFKDGCSIVNIEKVL